MRSNFLAMLFNYGTLVLNTGSETKLTFDDIPDPSRALQEINLQRFKNERAQKLTDIRKQAEQQVDVIAAYHRWAEEQRKSQDQEKPKDS